MKGDSRMYFELLILVMIHHPRFKVEVDRNDERIALTVRHSDKVLLERHKKGEVWYPDEPLTKEIMEDSAIGWTYRPDTDKIDVWPPGWTDEKMESEYSQIMKHVYHGNHC